MTEQEQTSKKSKTVDDREAMNLLEAALYVSGRPVDAKTLSSIIGTRSKRRVKALARSLAETYLRRGGAFELMELDGERFVLQLKPEYVPSVKRLVMRPLLSKGPLQTLAYIAYRQPVAQAHVAAIRGTQSYSHIRKLKELGLIATEKLGRTQIVRTTEVFADYFNLSHDLRLMKRQLKAPLQGSERAGEGGEGVRIGRNGPSTLS